jgi:mono/diheme cytochrome c family protein
VVRGPTRVAAGCLVAVLVGVAATVASIVRHGLSAHDEPSRIEHVLARAMRRYATPADLRGRKNPVPLTPEVLAEARAHFADHCATCHGNDGKGKTAMGPRFYPKAPDMTLGETQDMSDGEIFATIENGIRLTGMPAWGDGTAESAHGSWALVHFIRHLPRLTPEEIAEMEKLNPKPPGEVLAAREEEEFLTGGAQAPADGKEAGSTGGHRH